MLNYRPDIDGLRAVAVIPIVLFHAGYEWISGGFVGVDIFFVISGFLISSIIQNEISQGKFSFIGFYERRLRRIIPALLTVLLATMLVGYFLLLPEEYAELAKSSMAAGAFFPNIYFWATSSTYFGLDIVSTPLLHTWSLGVEEQFYIIFPVLIYLLLTRFSIKYVARIIIALLVLSLCANLFLVEIAANSKFAFYMLPTRAWELLAGVVLSLGILPKIHRPVIANSISLLGFVLIVLTMLRLNENSLFPGINAIWPVFGTALIIYSGTHQPTVISRILTNQLLVGIGVISYSLYLWHWPVTVYTNMYWESDYNKLFIISASLILAFMSYRLIETRFRKCSKTELRIGKLKEIGVLSVLVSIVCVAILNNDGIPDRVPKDALKHIATDTLRAGNQQCEQFTGNTKLDANICAIGTKNTLPSFVLWGDSHAQAIADALHLAALEMEISGVLVTSHGCRPLVGVYRKSKRRCETFNNRVVEYINNQPSLKHVFLAGYWRIPFTSQGYDNSNFLIVDDQTRFRSPEENRKVFKRGMQRTLDTLESSNPVIIQDIPEIGSQFGKSVANHFARRIWKGNTAFKELVYTTEHDSFDREFKQLLNSYSSHPNFIDVNTVLCVQSKCPLRKKGQLIYADGDHLSKYGASLLAPTFLDYFKNRTSQNSL